MPSKPKFYAVAAGREPGIYQEWFGPNGAEAQVNGFPGARYQGFPTHLAAQTWLSQQNAVVRRTASRSPAGGPTSSGDSRANPHREGSNLRDEPHRAAISARPQADIPSLPRAPGRLSAASRQIDEQAAQALADGEVVIFTDGACTGNPGPGGWAAVMRYKEHRNEISGGYARTTNNRMELTACIAALRLLQRPSRVALFSDSSYVIQGIEKGWAKRWRARGWMRNAREAAENPDLWGELLQLCEKHQVRFIWLRGHAGHPENERCDQLAVAAAHRPDLPPDTGYRR